MAQAAPLANGSRRKDYLAEDKWREIYVNQLSVFINLVLGMATAAVGFCISYLVGHPHSAPDFAAFRIFTIVFMFSIGFGVACTLIRLDMFDKRRRDYNHAEQRIKVECYPEFPPVARHKHLRIALDFLSFVQHDFIGLCRQHGSKANNT